MGLRWTRRSADAIRTVRPQLSIDLFSAAPWARRHGPPPGVIRAGHDVPENAQFLAKSGNTCYAFLFVGFCCMGAMRRDFEAFDAEPETREKNFCLNRA